MDIEGIVEPGKEIRGRREKQGKLGQGAGNDGVL